MRPDGWFFELCGALARSADERFQYGLHDCCTFVASCIDAMTGSQHRQTLADRYQDHRGALAFIKEHGGMLAAISSILGAPSRARTRTGDCVLYRERNKVTCGIVFGPLILSAASVGFGVKLRRGILAHWSI